MRTNPEWGSSGGGEQIRWHTISWSILVLERPEHKWERRSAEATEKSNIMPGEHLHERHHSAIG